MVLKGLQKYRKAGAVFLIFALMLTLLWPVQFAIEADSSNLPMVKQALKDALVAATKSAATEFDEVALHQGKFMIDRNKALETFKMIMGNNLKVDSSTWMPKEGSPLSSPLHVRVYLYNDWKEAKFPNGVLPLMEDGNTQIPLQDLTITVKKPTILAIASFAYTSFWGKKEVVTEYASAQLNVKDDEEASGLHPGIIKTIDQGVPKLTYKNGTVIDGGEEIKYEFRYTGAVQKWTAPYTGRYKLEVWGAKGGGFYGGEGGYSRGEVVLNAGETLYVYVGGVGSVIQAKQSGIAMGGWNGGGNGFSEARQEFYGNVGGGGGATDIRRGGQKLTDRIIVAGGGGGSSGGVGHYQKRVGGDGGGFFGETGGNNNEGEGTGGTQTSGGLGDEWGTPGTSGGLGLGGSANYQDNVFRENSVTEVAGGGGGGYYGGGSGSIHSGAGGGGSGYIGGVENGYTQTGGSGGAGYAVITLMGNEILKDKYVFNVAYGIQEWVAPREGRYRLEVWGAEGGGGIDEAGVNFPGGKGGYSVGEISLKKGDILYVNVGGMGFKIITDGFMFEGIGGWNGGGAGGLYSYGGGGASDIRRGFIIPSPKEMSDEDFQRYKGYDPYLHRIIVAGGGGGASEGVKSSYYQTGWGGDGGKSIEEPSSKRWSKGQDDSDFYGGGGGGSVGGSTGDWSHAGGYGGASYIGGVENGRVESGVRTGSGLIIITPISIIDSSDVDVNWDDSNVFPSLFEKGETQSIHVSLANLSSEDTWGSSDTSIIIEWRRTLDNLLIKSQEIPVSHNVGPGEKLDQDISITAPSITGKYNVVYKVIKNGNPVGSKLVFSDIEVIEPIFKVDWDETNVFPVFLEQSEQVSVPIRFKNSSSKEWMASDIELHIEWRNKISNALVHTISIPLSFSVGIGEQYEQMAVFDVTSIPIGDYTVTYNLVNKNSGLSGNKIQVFETSIIGSSNTSKGIIQTVRNDNTVPTTINGTITNDNMSEQVFRFEFTGATQTWTVPYTGRYILSAFGAGGMDENYSGRGAFVEGEKDLKAGEVLYIYVGGKNGWNGGGTGRALWQTGGGASDIRYKGNTLNHRILVAGGGGGAGSGVSFDGSIGRGGDAGGEIRNGLKGDDGVQGTYGIPGKGGTQTSGGLGGAVGGQNGSFGVGGSNTSGVRGGGGGGGGWYGGGAGGSPRDTSGFGSGGGGGSSYVGGVENARASRGANGGDGLVQIKLMGKSYWGSAKWSETNTFPTPFNKKETKAVSISLTNPSDGSVWDQSNTSIKVEWRNSSDHLLIQSQTFPIAHRVNPGDNISQTLNITAPDTEGVYDVVYKLIKDDEEANGFQTFTGVEVKNRFKVEWDVNNVFPSTILQGNENIISVRMTNPMEMSWSPSDVRLNLEWRRKSNDELMSALSIPLSSYVGPGESYEQTISFVTPELPPDDYIVTYNLINTVLGIGGDKIQVFETSIRQGKELGNVVLINLVRPPEPIQLPVNLSDSALIPIKTGYNITLYVKSSKNATAELELFSEGRSIPVGYGSEKYSSLKTQIPEGGGHITFYVPEDVQKGVILDVRLTLSGETTSVYFINQAFKVYGMSYEDILVNRTN